MTVPLQPAARSTRENAREMGRAIVEKRMACRSASGGPARNRAFAPGFYVRPEKATWHNRCHFMLERPDVAPHARRDGHARDVSALQPVPLRSRRLLRSAARA